MRICATQAQQSLYIHTAHMTPGPGVLWGVPGPSGSLPGHFRQMSLCSFLKTLSGRFPSLSWQHFLTSNNPHHQQIVFLILKWTPSGSISLLMLFLCAQRGWEELISFGIKWTCRCTKITTKWPHTQPSLPGAEQSFFQCFQRSYCPCFNGVAFPHNPP